MRVRARARCAQKSPESLLAARYILHRWPRMLSEKYQLGPQKLVDPDPADDPGMYAGESVLHQCIVKEARTLRRVQGSGAMQRGGPTTPSTRGGAHVAVARCAWLTRALPHACARQERALLLFAEKAQNVHNGLGQLRKLANERDYSHVALQPEGRLVERAKALVEHSLHGRGKVAPADELETVEAAAAEAAACVRQRAKDAEPAQVSLPLSLATFFSKGNSCYYGGACARGGRRGAAAVCLTGGRVGATAAGYPLSFAAATGGPLWYFMYLVRGRLGRRRGEAASGGRTHETLTPPRRRR